MNKTKGFFYKKKIMLKPNEKFIKNQKNKKLKSKVLFEIENLTTWL
jgi:hypothetical protein